LRGIEGIDPAQLQNLLRNLAQLDDERTYQNASELLRLQTAVAEQLKRFDYALRRKAAEENAVALSGSDEVPESHKTLVEEYYRSLARAPR
jgi:conjugal transfer/entry exclusion protein